MTSWVEYQRRRLSSDPSEREPDVPWFVGDKLKAYEFAERHGVATPHRYAVWSAPLDFDSENLPDHFVLKPKGMHSTSGVMPLQRLSTNLFFDLLRKRELTIQQIKDEQTALFERNKYKSTYRLFAEEFMFAENGDPSFIPNDYKFYCFHDEVELISQYDRNQKPPRVAWFVREFEPFAEHEYVTSDWVKIHRGVPQLPACHLELVQAAKTLSAALMTPFVSVDLYATPRGAVLGELTLAPGAPYHGTMYKFLPHYDEYLGGCWERAAAKISLKKMTTNDVA